MSKLWSARISQTFIKQESIMRTLVSIRKESSTLVKVHSFALTEVFQDLLANAHVEQAESGMV